MIARNVANQNIDTNDDEYTHFVQILYSFLHLAGAGENDAFGLSTYRNLHFRI